jgi:hypothetical protein
VEGEPNIGENCHDSVLLREFKGSLSVCLVYDLEFPNPTYYANLHFSCIQGFLSNGA